jgi:hypothetical protein
MGLSDMDQLILRARATSVLGYAAVAIGREAFMPHFPEVMELAGQSLTLEHEELTEYTILFFGHMAAVMKVRWGEAKSRPRCSI